MCGTVDGMTAPTPETSESSTDMHAAGSYACVYRGLAAATAHLDEYSKSIAVSMVNGDIPHDQRFLDGCSSAFSHMMVLRDLVKETIAMAAVDPEVEQSPCPVCNPNLETDHSPSNPAQSQA